MKRDDILVLKAVLLYIIKNLSANKQRVYSIVKAAFYAQQIHFAKYGLPIYNDKIKALKFGPVPSTAYDILKVARGNDSVKQYNIGTDLDIVANSIDFQDEFYSIKEEPDMSYLSSSDVECLNAAIYKVNQMTFDQIMTDTHGAEWNRVYNSKSRSKIMNNINIAKEGGADDATAEYLHESLKLDKAFC